MPLEHPCNKNGGIAIPYPPTATDLSNQVSACHSGHLVDYLKDKELLDHSYCIKTITEARAESAPKNHRVMR